MITKLPYPKFVKSSLLLVLIVGSFVNSGTVVQETSSIEDENMTKIMFTLQMKLSKTDCYRLAKYFAFQPWVQQNHELKANKVSYQDFKCGAALKFWKSNVTSEGLNVLDRNELQMTQKKDLLQEVKQILAHISDSDLSIMDVQIPTDQTNNRFPVLGEDQDLEDISIDVTSDPERTEEVTFIMYLLIIGVVGIIVLGCCYAYCHLCRRNSIRLIPVHEARLPGAQGGLAFTIRMEP